MKTKMNWFIGSALIVSFWIDAFLFYNKTAFTMAFGGTVALFLYAGCLAFSVSGEDDDD